MALFSKKQQPVVADLSFEVGERKIPAKIYLEVRQGVRFSLGKRGAILRVPLHLPADLRQQEILRFKNWVAEKIMEKGAPEEHAIGKTYQHGDQLAVGSRSYSILFEWTDNNNHSARRNDRDITLRLTRKDSGEPLQKAIRLLLSRVVAHDFLPQIERRVNELNHLYFKKSISSVVLKYNTSNWGSCSNKGNINLSTCLLFAPDSVIDYVIIHELAHLVEMNHSPRFWKLVEEAMPDYKEKKKWLRQHWHVCNF